MTREEQQVHEMMRRSGRNAAILTAAVLLLAVAYFVAIYFLGRG